MFCSCYLSSVQRHLLSLIASSTVISLFYYDLHKLRAPCARMFVCLHVHLCLCVCACTIVCIFVYSCGQYYYHHQALPKYWGIYVSVNLLCLSFGLRDLVKFLFCVCNCLNSSGWERNRASFASFTMY